MPTDMPLSEQSALPEGPFDGRVAFDVHLRSAFDAAAQQGWREIVLSDPGFAAWPLG